MQQPSRQSVGIVGGGLAGLAAALALAERGWRVELFEATRRLGGRAGSFHDIQSGEAIDHCQHLAMGCCTNFADFCRRAGVEDLLRRDRRLHFIAPDGRRYNFAAAGWLPAPLHLAPALLRLGLLSWRDRFAVGRALLRLARTDRRDDEHYGTIGRWLAEQRQSPAALEQFWGVVLVSALSESLERAALSAARQVFVTGFLANRESYEIVVPTAPLGEIYGDRLAAKLARCGASLHTGEPVEQIEIAQGRASGLRLKHSGLRPFDNVILAVPWRRAVELLPADFETPDGPLRCALAAVAELPSAPITAVHLWFDRPLTPLPHAVLVGRLSQWFFARGERDIPPGDSPTGENANGHYYQVVISASRQLAGRSKESIRDEVLEDLGCVLPAARGARLLQWRIVTQPEAVFAPTPENERLRPPQTTSVANLLLAGDWTRTGWPATMEGAVRSGYLAAEGVLRAASRPEQILQPDLPRGWLARRLLK